MLDRRRAPGPGSKHLHSGRGRLDPLVLLSNLIPRPSVHPLPPSSCPLPDIHVCSCSSRYSKGSPLLSGIHLLQLLPVHLCVSIESPCRGYLCDSQRGRYGLGLEKEWRGKNVLELRRKVVARIVVVPRLLPQVLCRVAARGLCVLLLPVWLLCRACQREWL